MELVGAAAIFVVVEAKSNISRHTQRGPLRSRVADCHGRASGYELTSNKAPRNKKILSIRCATASSRRSCFKLFFGGLASEGIEERGDAL